jgi:hypothetical protein
MVLRLHVKAISLRCLLLCSEWLAGVAVAVGCSLSSAMSAQLQLLPPYTYHQLLLQPSLLATYVCFMIAM